MPFVDLFFSLCYALVNLSKELLEVPFIALLFKLWCVKGPTEAKSVEGGVFLPSAASFSLFSQALHLLFKVEAAFLSICHTKDPIELVLLSRWWVGNTRRLMALNIFEFILGLLVEGACKIGSARPPKWP